MIFSAKDVSLGHLGTTRVTYEPKNIVAEAIQVTHENIGALSLEFETDLCYFNNGSPFLEITVERKTSEGAPAPDRYMQIRLEDWIVPLRGEIHVFRDPHFVNTFEFETFNRAFTEPELKTAHEPRADLDLSRVNLADAAEFTAKSLKDGLSDSAQWATGVISSEEHETRIARES